MAQVHYDEDTPHLQAYFLPIVNEVKRKCYKRDSEENLIKENGKIMLLRDEDNKIIYESIKGNFLSNDQFWKDLGGRNSFTNIQDKFNKYITDCGYKLDRGNIGSNKVHQTKLEYKINELKSEMNNLYKDIEKYNIELNRKPMRYVSDYISLADSIKAANRLNKEVEGAANEFHKLFEL